jgi:hypothetical protein
MNSGMSRRVQRLRAGRKFIGAELAPALAELAAGRLVETDQGIVLERLLPKTIDPNVFQDKTGFEAWINKIHVEDYVDETTQGADDVLLQGLLYAERLAAKFAARGGAFRIFLCVDNDSNDVTCRFHVVREGEPWFIDDPNLTDIASVAIWDVGGAAVSHNGDR